MTPDQVDDVMESLGLVVYKLSRTVPSACALAGRELADALVVLGVQTPVVPEGWRPPGESNTRRRTARQYIIAAMRHLDADDGVQLPKSTVRDLLGAWDVLGLPRVEIKPEDT